MRRRVILQGSVARGSIVRKTDASNLPRGILARARQSVATAASQATAVTTRPSRWGSFGDRCHANNRLPSLAAGFSDRNDHTSLRSGRPDSNRRRPAGKLARAWASPSSSLCASCSLTQRAVPDLLQVRQRSTAQPQHTSSMHNVLHDALRRGSLAFVTCASDKWRRTHTSICA
jgi:hypothetical protein